MDTGKAVTQRAVKETAETRQLGKRIGTKVTIHHTAKGGRIEIHFKDDSQLSELYAKLG